MDFRSLYPELKADLHSDKALPALFAGLINGIIITITAVSFAAMLFSGEMAGFAGRGAGLTLFGACMMGVVLFLNSGLKTHVSVPQDAPTATLVAAVPVAAALLSLSPEAAFMTLVGILFMTSVLTGLCFFLIGRYRLANLFRFVPYPVIGGFLAGSGWFLLTGGIAVMCGVTPGLSTLSALIAPDALVKWVPGILLTLILFLILLRWSHYLIMPVAMLTGGILYYLVFFLLDLPLARVRELGFFLSGLPEQGLWPAFHLSSFGEIHWNLVITQLPLAASVTLVCILGMLLNVSGVEISANEDIDLNREFTSLGIANMAAATGGSLPGYTALSFSLLGIRMKARTRLCGLVSTALVAFVLVAGGKVLTFFPVPLLGAFLSLLGAFFLWDWIVLTYRRMPRVDYIVILIIATIVVWKGFLFGVAAGLAVTLLIFVVRFSRVSIVQRFTDLSRMRSQKARSAPDQLLLKKSGQQALCYQLEGYLFFGSTSLFVEALRSELPDQCRVLILDFSAVSGIDISAARNFQRLLQTTSKKEIQCYLAAVPTALAEDLAGQPGRLNIRMADRLEIALVWAEEVLLEAAHQQLSDDDGSARGDLFDLSVDEMMQQLERQAWGETLAEALSVWGRQQQFPAGKRVLSPAEPVPGLLFLVSGILRMESSSQGAAQEFTGGTALYPRAQFVDCHSSFRLETVGDVVLLVLTQANRQVLEQQRPDLALELDRFLMTQDKDNSDCFA